jgi:hypothetical protein
MPRAFFIAMLAVLMADASGVSSLVEVIKRRTSIFGQPRYAALWKSSIWRTQLVSGFHLGKIWATNSKLLILKKLKSATHSVDRTAGRSRSVSRADSLVHVPQT